MGADRACLEGKRTLRRIGLILFGTGLTGFLTFGSGIDSAATCAILTAASFLVAAVGYKLWMRSEQRLTLEESERIRKEREIEAAEEAIARAKEATFQMWLTAGRLDV